MFDPPNWGNETGLKCLNDTFLRPWIIVHLELIGTCYDFAAVDMGTCKKSCTKLHLGIFHVWEEEHKYVRKLRLLMNPTTFLGRCWGSSSSCYPWVSACHSARHCEEERFSGSPRISKVWWEEAGANLANSHHIYIYIRIYYIYIYSTYICLSWRLKRLHPLIMKVGGKEKCQQQNTLVSH